MAKQNINTYKQFVKDAKKRLATNGYQEIAALNRTGIKDRAYLVNSKMVSGEELYAYYRRVAELQEAGMVTGALGQLIDDSVYESMSPPARERYVLAMSRIYRDLKDEFERQNRELNNVK